MQLIDFAKLNHQCLNATMTDIGMADFSNLPFPIILERLNLGSNRVTEECFLIQQPAGKIDLSGSVQALRQQRKIADAIGPTKISSNMPIYFSTFVGSKPKKYLKQYVEVAKILCGHSANRLRFVVWLEDTLTILRNGWDVSTAQQVIDAYKAFFTKECWECQVMLSSKIAPVGIPQSFVEKLSVITTEEFLSALPFHLRNPMFVKILDIVHFVWNCYVLYRLQGVHLAGITNKRHFQLFRKVVGTKVTAILLPLGSESVLT